LVFILIFFRWRLGWWNDYIFFFSHGNFYPGVGARHALFPVRTTFGALAVWRARCFPTLLTAACDDVGLIAGPFRPFQIGIFRVRPLRPVR
jgi:hypothetical protein